MSSFFLWYYWFINIGAFLGYVMSVTHDTVTTMAMWCVPLALGLLFTLSLLFLGYQKDTPSTRASRVCLEAVRQNLVCFSCVSPSFVFDSTSAESLLKRHNGLRRLYRHMAHMFLIISVTVMFNILYSIQISWISLVHDTEISSNTTHDTTYWLMNLYDPGTVIVLAPITYFFILPLIRMCCPSAVRQLKLMGIGMVIAALSFVVSAMMETLRQQGIYEHPSLLSKLPQFALMGLAELFTNVVGYEFAYMEAPKGIKSTMVGVFFCSLGVGFYIGLGLIYLLKFSVRDWTDNSDLNHVQIFLYTLAALQILVLLLFVSLTRRYQYISDHGENLSINKLDTDSTSYLLDHPEDGE